MAELRHTANELKQMQSLPLDIKIKMSCRRIQEWYDYWQGDVYVSFSGGKDSTVLMDLVRNKCGLKDVPIVFIDTGLEYPEVREMGRKYADVVLRPEKNFKEILTDCGYPIISKEVSQIVNYANRYLRERKRESSYTKYSYYYRRLAKLGEYVEGGKRSSYSLERYKYLLDADFNISNQCCDYMKKKPCRKYEKETKRKPFMGVMAQESWYRKQGWLRTGCNAFEGKRPKSLPMSFWTESDVLQYIAENNLKFAKVYGNIIQNENGKYETTGVSRTGCVFCIFGCHLEKEPNRFQKLKETHPRLYDYCINGGEYNEDGNWQPSKDGLGIGHVLDFIGVNYK